MHAPSFWARRGGLADLLAPIGRLYDLAGRLRRRTTAPARASVPVLCVGNLVVGGAGKTPVVMALAERLTAMGCRVHLLTRGYGGSEAGPLQVDPRCHDAARVGDEALLLARVAPTWVARRRAAGAEAAAAAGAEILLLDDGFQNPTLHKDLSLLVIDGAYGLGNGLVMPAGPLRESAAGGLARADAVVLVGRDATGFGQAVAGREVIGARLVPEGAAAAGLAGSRVLAFAGIGRPEKFFATLEALGAEVVERRAFPDHHPYHAEEIGRLIARARDLDARLVTTEKDAARLAPELARQVETLPVAIVWDDPVRLDRLLAGVAAR